MADENTATDETVEEKTEAAETGATPEESHREDGFEDLVARVGSLEEKASNILDIVGALREALGSFVENGGVVRDDSDTDTETVPEDTDGDPDIDMSVPIEDMDFSLDEARA